jgi:hypothetical protein
MKRTKKPTGPTDEQLIAGLFKPEEIETNLDGKYKTLEGLWVVLKPLALSEHHRTRTKLLWKATGGFGCNLAPGSRGGALFAKCFEDGEESRWQGPWADVYGVFVGELPKELRKFKLTVIRTTTQTKELEVEAVSAAEARKTAIELCPSGLGFSTPEIEYTTGELQELKDQTAEESESEAMETAQ